MNRLFLIESQYTLILRRNFLQFTHYGKKNKKCLLKSFTDLSDSRSVVLKLHLVGVSFGVIAKNTDAWLLQKDLNLVGLVGPQLPILSSIPDDYDTGGLWVTLWKTLLWRILYKLVKNVKEVRIMYNQFKGLELNYCNIDHSDHLLLNCPSTKEVKNSVITENIRLTYMEVNKKGFFLTQFYILDEHFHSRCISY